MVCRSRDLSSPRRPPGIDLDRSKDVIILDPAAYDAAAGDAWFGRLTTYAEQRAAAEVRQRENRHSYSGHGNVERSAAAVARGWRLYKEYGPAVRKVTPLLRPLELQYLYPNEVKKLPKLLGEIEANIAGMADEAAAIGSKPEAAVLDYEFVVKAVRLLTDLDRDRNTLANKLGWGRETTAPGHWCCSLLKADRQRVIEIGRGLVSHHLVQLKTLGLEPVGGR